MSMRIQLRPAHAHRVRAGLRDTRKKSVSGATGRRRSFLFLLLPGDKPVQDEAPIKADRLRAAVLRIRIEHIEELLDITPGSVSVLGLMNDTQQRVHLLIDNDLLADEHLGCHPCINTSTLRIAMGNVLHKLIPAMGHEPAFVILPWNPEELRQNAVPSERKASPGRRLCIVLSAHVHARDAL